MHADSTIARSWNTSFLGTQAAIITGLALHTCNKGIVCPQLCSTAAHNCVQLLPTTVFNCCPQLCSTAAHNCVKLLPTTVFNCCPQLCSTAAHNCVQLLPTTVFSCCPQLCSAGAHNPQHISCTSPQKPLNPHNCSPFSSLKPSWSLQIKCGLLARYSLLASRAHPSRHLPPTGQLPRCLLCACSATE